MNMERKLTAILSADVKGYSRLMGEDEEATIRTLTAYRKEMDRVFTTLLEKPDPPTLLVASDKQI